jgi:hypothetical protein
MRTPESAPTPPNPGKPIKIKARKCRYCGLMFTPRCTRKQQRTNAQRQKFCCIEHRNAFHCNGSISFERVCEKVAVKVADALKSDKKFLAAVHAAAIAAAKPPENPHAIPQH